MSYSYNSYVIYCYWQKQMYSIKLKSVFFCIIWINNFDISSFSSNVFMISLFIVEVDMKFIVRLKLFKSLVFSLNASWNFVHVYRIAAFKWLVDNLLLDSGLKIIFFCGSIGKTTFGNVAMYNCQFYYEFTS